MPFISSQIILKNLISFLNSKFPRKCNFYEKKNGRTNRIGGSGLWEADRDERDEEAKQQKRKKKIMIIIKYV